MRRVSWRGERQEREGSGEGKWAVGRMALDAEGGMRRAKVVTTTVLLLIAVVASEGGAQNL
jgi:hypothetical protein